MKLPARLALVASTGTLLVAGLTVGTGFASTVRDAGADQLGIRRAANPAD